MNGVGGFELIVILILVILLIKPKEIPVFINDLTLIYHQVRTWLYTKFSS